MKVRRLVLVARALLVLGLFSSPARAFQLPMDGSQGNAELKMGLIDIKSEANRLRERKAKRVEATTEDRLRALKHKLDRGGLSQEDYQREKDRLLKGLNENPHR